MLPDARNHISDSSIFKHAGCARRTWYSQRPALRKEAALPEDAGAWDALRDYKAALNKLYQESYAPPGTPTAAGHKKQAAVATSQFMQAGATLILDPCLEVERNPATKEGGLSATPAALKRITRAASSGSVSFYIPVYCEPTVDFHGGAETSLPREIDLKLAHACTLLGQLSGHRPPLAEVMDRHGTVSVVFPDFDAHAKTVAEIHQLADRVSAPEMIPCRSCQSCPWQHACFREARSQGSLWMIPGMTPELKASVENRGIHDTFDSTALRAQPRGEWMAARAHASHSGEIVIAPAGTSQEREVLDELGAGTGCRHAVYLDLLFRDRFDGKYAGFALHGQLRKPMTHFLELSPDGPSPGALPLRQHLHSFLAPGTTVFVWSDRERRFLEDNQISLGTLPVVALKEQLLDVAIHLPFLHQTPETIARAIEGSITAGPTSSSGDPVEAHLVGWMKARDQEHRDRLEKALAQRARNLFAVTEKCRRWLPAGTCDQAIHRDQLPELTGAIPERYYNADKSTERRVVVSADVRDVVPAPALERQRGRILSGRAR